MKNVDPYLESAILKDASKYSVAWINVKYTPKVKVKKREENAWEWFISISLWWDHVILTPEDKRIMVLRSGTLKGLNTSIPVGGQILPNSMLGANLLWKKAQKKDKKNMTSDKINKIMPHRNPFSTIRVWSPWNLASRLTSRHHWLDTTTNKTSLLKNRVVLEWWNHRTIPEVSPKAETADSKGQGDSSTKWNGCTTKFDIFNSLYLKILILEIKDTLRV